MAALAAFGLRYGHAAAWRVPADQRAHVDRAVDTAATDFGTSPGEIRRSTRPFVRQLPDRTCVMLRTGTIWLDGSYEACRARRDGRLLWSRAYGWTFGPRSLWHRAQDAFWALVW